MKIPKVEYFIERIEKSNGMKNDDGFNMKCRPSDIGKEEYLYKMENFIRK